MREQIKIWLGIIGENVVLRKKPDDIYLKYDIVADKKVIGLLEVWHNKNNGYMEIISIEIPERELRNRGYGSAALAIFKEKTNLPIVADCLSQQSFFSFVKALGKPSAFGNIFREFKTYQEVKDYLPLEASYDSEGKMIGSSDSSVWVQYRKQK